ncbi:hypothetical protein EJO63_21780, partial [Escherichia coli]|nr:hypothetical protein [Escherichia coli]EFJ7228835.1 hypothetical protein [Escherichia coli]EFN7310282.1 hypothetical protein [Escherichia coli]
MNKAYSIVWNSSRQAWVVASELARGHGFVLAKNTLLVLTVASAVGNAFAQDCKAGSQNASNCVITAGSVVVGKTQYVYAQGQTSNVIVNGKQVVSNGGKTSATTITSGGYQFVGTDGSASATVVSSGGKQA